MRLQFLDARIAPAVGYFRIVSYNVAASSGSPAAGLDTILQAIGNETVAGQAEPIDLIALQEVENQTTTTQDVVNLLNGIYGAGVYDRGIINGASTGAGTQGIVFNTNTLELVSEAVIGVSSTTGQPRQALRYRMHPVGYSPSADFYVYNSHYKADSDGTSQDRRLVEANAIRADADALGNGASIIFTGDFNAYNSSEEFYQALLATGNGQAFDPINRPGAWHDSASFVDIATQAPAVNPPGGLTGGGLDDRFDFHLVSGEVTDGQAFEYVSSTYHTFGNNGSVALNGNINDANSTALPALPNRLQVLDLLTTVADHLPVVADFHVLSAPTATTTLLSSAPNPAAVGQAVTFTATVSGTGGTPTGSVTFRKGFLPLGTGSLNGAGMATFTTSFQITGTLPITALYGGDSQFLSSTSAVYTQRVVAPVPFRTGDLVVLQVGDGIAALGTGAAPISLREFTPSGTSVQTVTVPSAGTNALTVSGSSRFVGYLTRSANGQSLSLAGINAAAGTPGVDSTPSSSNNRVVARVDNGANLDTTTRLGSADYNGFAIDGAVANDGSGFWTWGAGMGGNTGLRYAGYGNAPSMPAVQIQTRVFSPRHLGIFANQLYLTSSFLTTTAPAVGLLDKVGVGLPTTAGQTVAPVSGFPQASGPSPFGFVLLDLNPAVPGPDTAYVADDRTIGTGGGLQKWTTGGGAWTLQYTLTGGLVAGLRALTGTVNPSHQAVLYATTADSATRLVAVTDTGAAAGFTTLATAPANFAFRGVAFAPSRIKKYEPAADSADPLGREIPGDSTPQLDPIRPWYWAPVDDREPVIPVWSPVPDRLTSKGDRRGQAHRLGGQCDQGGPQD